MTKALDQSVISTTVELLQFVQEVSALFVRDRNRNCIVAACDHLERELSAIHGKHSVLMVYGCKHRNQSAGVFSREYGAAFSSLEEAARKCDELRKLQNVAVTEADGTESHLQATIAVTSCDTEAGLFCHTKRLTSHVRSIRDFFTGLSDHHTSLVLLAKMIAAGKDAIAEGERWLVVAFRSSADGNHPDCRLFWASDINTADGLWLNKGLQGEYRRRDLELFAQDQPVSRTGASL